MPRLGRFHVCLQGWFPGGQSPVIMVLRLSADAYLSYSTRATNPAILRRRAFPAWALGLVCAFHPVLQARAQEIEPRAFSPSPVGATFFLAAAARSTGGILTDPSLPVDDVEAEINSIALGFGRTFALWGHTASAALVQPYTE